MRDQKLSEFAVNQLDHWIKWAQLPRSHLQRIPGKQIKNQQTSTDLIIGTFGHPHVAACDHHFINFGLRWMFTLQSGLRDDNSRKTSVFKYSLNPYIVIEQLVLQQTPNSILGRSCSA